MLKLKLFEIFFYKQASAGELSVSNILKKYSVSIIKPKLSDFLLDLHQSFAHQGLAKSLDISIGMPTLFANLAASRS